MYDMPSFNPQNRGGDIQAMDDDPGFVAMGQFFIS